MSVDIKFYFAERAQLFRHEMDGRKLRRNLNVPYLELTLPPWNSNLLFREALAVLDKFVTHSAGEGEGWKSLCVHGLASHKTLSFDRYGYASEAETPYVWTSVANLCPLTAKWLGELITSGFFTVLYRARFMLLAPGGFIAFHRDKPEGQTGLGPVNVALNMPDRCEWLFKNWGPVPFQAGKAFCLDVSHEHGVWNRSGEHRIHVIVHGEYGPGYYNAISQATALLRG